ncbi:hypothetical protein GOP47_0023380 [Adiantum capillus-veneris]|uniref:Uncharacterized protein n=1 Tax=Adiantum capillus-veneris TaxID=13818 RepID=A0A9D4U3V6_ADICA|nr:hypothetical protein GOP47_0023380 [Adiantum capillus-veneris]
MASHGSEHHVGGNINLPPTQPRPNPSLNIVPNQSSPKSQTHIVGANNNANSPEVESDVHSHNTEPPPLEDALVIDKQDLDNWFDQLSDRVLIGLCHGPRPPLDALKR